MKKNVGSVDKVIRIIIGIVLLSMLFWVEGSLKWVGLVGIVPLFTALFGWCAIYQLFGINTCKTK